MKQIEITTENFIKGLPKVLIKDLCDDEVICPVCKGIGLIKRDYGFYMKGTDLFNRINKYNKEYLSDCPNCYNGVVTVCNHCKKPNRKGYISCDCKGYKFQKLKEEEQKVEKLYENAEKITLEEANNRDMMLFDYWGDKYYSVDDIHDFEPDDEEDQLPKWMFGTYKMGLSIDIQSLIENACDELHEEASNNLDNIEELEQFVNDWCAKQKGTDTYYADYKIVVTL